MSAESLKTVNYRNTSTPQSEKAVAGQKQNNAGGFSFKVGDFERAKRFVILGSEKSYYQAGAKLTSENAKTVKKVIESGRSKELTDYVVEVSTQGRAPKQQPGLFVLAMLSSFGTVEEKQYALSKLNAVARTGTTLFEFVTFALQFRSWGRALKNAVANWYTARSVDKLAYQMVKYQNREGWSHGDLLKLTHAKQDNAQFNELAKWVLGREVTSPDNLPRIVQGYELAKDSASEKSLIEYINEYDLTWEMVPNDRRSAAVWKNLLPTMPLGALLRQLSTLTRLEILKPLSAELASVVVRFSSPEEIQKARLHPIQILLALKTYASGGRYGKSKYTWTPVQAVVQALNDAFYLAFKNVEPTGQRYFIGLDVSGSMGTGVVGSEFLSAAEATSALSMVIQKTEPQTFVTAFSSGTGAWEAPGRRRGYYGSGIAPFDISKATRLDDVLKKARSVNFGGTDCALPMLYATEKKLQVDTFIVMTDNETWAGEIHPFEALKRYRKASGINAKLVVLATSATGFSIADPSDAGMLDVAGFDSAVPQVIAEFSKG